MRLTRVGLGQYSGERLDGENSSRVELQERTAAQVDKRNRERGCVLKIWNQTKNLVGLL